jgi:hypothetical protein
VGAALAFEDLTNIRQSLNQKPRSKTERRRTNNWAFYQLRLFVGYKANIARIRLFLFHLLTPLKPVPGADIFTLKKVNRIAMGKNLSVGIVDLNMMLSAIRSGETQQWEDSRLL